MEMNFTCIGKDGMEPGHWEGHMRIFSLQMPYELEVTARYSSFHILCGGHRYGNYICIPNWNIGTELSGLSDRFWNYERLTTYYPQLSKVDAVSIVCALLKLDEYLSDR